MVRPTSAFYEMTLVGGTLAIGLRESRSGCCIADDTGEFDTPKGSPAQIRSAFTLDNGPSRLRLACPFCANNGLMHHSGFAAGTLIAERPRTRRAANFSASWPLI